LFDDATGRMTGMEFTSQELLELSAVPIPANPEAVARAIASGVVTKDAAAQFFLARGGRLATKEDWDGLLPSLEKLEESVARLKGRIRGGEAAKIATAEEFERALRAGRAKVSSRESARPIYQSIYAYLCMILARSRPISLVFM